MPSLFDEAVNALLNDHQSKSKEAIEKAASRRTHTIQDMQQYLKRLGITSLPARILHVTGTKGKGSTCAICESILRHHGLKTGLFTSPHLIDIRERIRINGKLVSQKDFAEAYWTVRRKLEEHTDAEDLPALPGYFRMIALVAYWIFAHKPELDVVILEVGMGGRYDATNVFDMDQHQSVSGITVIDYDHVRVLGSMLEQIAWEKGGIYQRKKGDTQMLTPRPPEESTINRDDTPKGQNKYYALGTNKDSVLEVFRSCAALEGQGGSLVVVNEPVSNQVGLPGPHQQWNAALAVALCREFVAVEDAKLTDGLATVAWPARCQTVESKGSCYRIDGAHTIQSISVGLEWFREVSESGSGKRVLCFNCSHERNPVELLELLTQIPFDTAFFCKADSERPSSVPKPKAKELLPSSASSSDTEETWQDTLAILWKHLSKSTSSIQSNITAAQVVSCIESDSQVFVTGSLYLAGSFLTALDWSEPSDGE